MTKLEAVNAILRRLGLTPVAALDTGGISTQAQVERYLDDADRGCQAKGWHFNTRYNVELTQNGNGQVPVPASTYRIDTDGADSDTDVSVVGGLLYDLGNNTDVFNRNVRVTYVAHTAFTDLPQTFADYIVTEAAYQYNRAHKRNESLDGMLRDEAARRWSEAKRDDSSRGDVNILNTAEMIQLRGRPRMRDRSVW
jgi:hypothetical protein